MNFLNPSALWFGLLAVPIIIFYLLKIRRKEIEVSSTLLWRLALRDQQANTPWQKLKRNLLLLLQLIILSLIVMAAARLAFPRSSISSGSIVILIDGSASMQATDVSPNRFEAAKIAVAELVRETGADAAVSVILVTNQPRIIFAGENDKTEAIRMLADIKPELSEGNWSSAFSLASGLALTTGEPGSVTYVILSDGGLPDKSLAPLPGETRYIPIGSSTDNLAISALAARINPSGESAELFVRVSNYGLDQRSAQLTLLKDNEIILTEQVLLSAGESEQFILDGFEPRSAEFEARLSNIQANVQLDIFEPDDEAFTVLVPPAQKDVLLVSEGNLFLERLLLLFPHLSASKTSPEENGSISIAGTDFDLYILDGLLPVDELPDGQILLINPPENPIVNVIGEIELQSQARTTAHPLVNFLDWSSVHVDRTRQMELPDWGIPLVTTDETPLVFVGEFENRRMGVVGFDLHNSDLPLQVTFPILFANLFEYLAPSGMVANPNGALPGDKIEILPGTGAETLSIISPDKTERQFENPASEILFTDTNQPGIYNVRTISGGAFREAAFSINLFSEQESNLSVRGQIEIGSKTISATGQDEVSDQEILGWLIGLALLFLIIEWLAYHRRLGI